MIKNIPDLSPLLNTNRSNNLNLKNSFAAIAERLSSKISKEGTRDAAVNRISRQETTSTKHLLTYSPRSLAASKRPLDQIAEGTSTTAPIFKEGQAPSGWYKNGQFGIGQSIGQYSQTAGNQVLYAIDNYSGVLTQGHTSFTLNKETGEILRSEITRNSENFKGTDSVALGALSEADRLTTKPFATGKVVDGGLDFDNIEVRYEPGGKVSLTMKDPVSGQEISGQGIKDKYGNTIVALDNGYTYKSVIVGDSIYNPEIIP